MRLRIGIIALSLALALILALPVIAPADTSGTTQITGSIAATITSITPNSGVQGNSYPSVIITGTDLTNASSVSFGSNITVNTYTVDSDTQITASITLVSSASAGPRDVSVVAAGLTATKTSGFSVNASTFSITAPSAITLGNMVKGQTAKGHSLTPGSVTTNAENWTVVARDSNAGSNKGYMLKGSTPLLSGLRVGKSDPCTISAGDSNGLVYPRNATLPFYVEQDVSSDDVIGSYSITISFTGSTP